jgi:hypothetical protein
MVWCEQQTQFSETLLDPSRDVPDFVVKTNGKTSHKRFNVYRNNIMVSLTEAIIDAYPVVSQLVGEEFATAMARVYVADNLPRSPVLLEYGEGYANFIKHFEPAQTLPSLADIAKLEWAWLRSYHSTDVTALRIETLSNFAENKLGNLCFTFCDDVQLLHSSHPIVSIWSAHQGDRIGERLEDIKSVSEYVLVNRPLWNVEVRTLEPSTYRFFTSLQAGLPLSMAIDKCNTHSDFDPAKAINALFETQSVAAVKINNSASPDGSSHEFLF